MLKIKNLLLLIVFITGAFSLVIEVLASRILSPYYGNTIFTFSSVISVVLAALSFGYYFGGKLADKKTDLKIFFNIIIFSGLSVMISYLILRSLLPVIAYKNSIIYGPIISSLMLFLLPSFFLGMISPFAIAYIQKASKKEGAGSIAGQVFFFSTTGSIFGSLISGFYLVPNFGVNQILFTCGVFLILLGLIPQIILLKKIPFKLFFTAYFLITLSCSINSSVTYSKNVIHHYDGIYENIIIYEGTYNNRPTRFLIQDKNNSGAHYVNSDELVYSYAKYYDIYQLNPFKINKALSIGGGSYTIPKALLKDLPDITIDVVEIEPELYNLMQKYMFIQSNPRIRNHITDGRRFLHDTDNKYDYIFSDAYSSYYSIPSHMTTIEFYNLTKSKLSDNGIFIANIIGSLSSEVPSFLLSQIRTIREVFPNSYFFAVDDPNSLKIQNIIFVGLKNDNQQLLAKNKDSDIKRINFLNQQRIELNKYNLNSHTIFTDNYAPTEHFIANLIQDNL